MTISDYNKSTKLSTKIPAAKLISLSKFDVGIKTPVSPTGVPLEEEAQALRARNKILTDTLKAIKESADKEMKKNLELVWFARNRGRYPTHVDTKRIQESEEHREELEKLRSNDGDYHHGIHSGILAATRMFKEQADILHINDHKDLSTKLMAEASKHQGKIEKSLEAFPHVAVNNFPSSSK